MKSFIILFSQMSVQHPEGQVTCPRPRGWSEAEPGLTVRPPDSKSFLGTIAALRGASMSPQPSGERSFGPILQMWETTSLRG